MEVAQSRLRVHLLELGEMTVVGLDGELNADTAPQVDAAITLALQHDSTTIVLDCSLLRAMGRDEAIVLLDAYERVREVDGQLSLRQPPEEARWVVEAAGLSDRIQIEE
jgi:anti-anti-sigma factor